MNIKACEKKEKSEYQIIVEVSPEEFESAVGKAFIKNRKSISVPGFRKGKAPRKIVERMYGDSVFHPDALDILMPEVAEFTTKETDIKAVGYPQVTDVDIKEDKSGVEITMVQAVYPEVTLGDYKGLAAVKPSVDIPDSAIDAEVAGVQMRNARIEKADRPAINGDVVVIDFDGYVDGEQFDGGKSEGYELELGSNAFIPGFEDKLLGMSAGEERDIDLVFPEQYAENLAGKPVVFKVKLHEIKEKQLPELDDEFAKDVSEFDTLKEYKADIKDRLSNARQAEVDAAFENALLDKVVENMDVEVPDVMVEEQMDMSMNNFANQVSQMGMDPANYLKMMNVTPEMFRENMRVSSEKQVKVMLALEKIAELEGIEVSDEDIEKEYAEASERFGMEVEKIKESVPQDRVVSDIKTRMAVKIVTDSGVAEDPPAEGEAEGAPAKPKAKKAAAKTTAKATTAKAAPKTKKAAAADGDAVEDKPKKPAAKKAPAKKAAAKAADGDAVEEKPKKPAAKKEPAKKAPAKKAATKAADGDVAEEKPKKAAAAKKAPAKKAPAKKKDDAKSGKGDEA